MAKLTTSDVKAILASERADSLCADRSDTLSAERTRALNYYMGDVSADMPTIDGRSKAVSSDVADTIEGLMPSLMEIFAGSDDAVRFEPVGPQDVDAADQETAYVNHIFWQKNDGFLTLYSFVKDALLSKLGIVKVWWEENESEDRETYYDQTPEEFAIIAGDPEVSVVAHTEKQGEYGPTHDVTVAKKKTYGCARVMAVPPEEFGIARRSRNCRDTHYAFHEVQSSESELIAEGYDAELVKGLPTYSLLNTSESFSRDTVNESNSAVGDTGMNKASRPILVTEHYIRMDYEGRGMARLYRVVTGGQADGDVLERDGEPDITEIDHIPFAVMTPFIMPHRVFGRSVADVVMDIQRIKTALLRALLDNAYLANNPRIEVPEALANDHTISDLLVSRPGGIIRTKGNGGLPVLKHPDIGGDIFPMLQYFDSTREWRTGVTRQGQGIDANALNNQTATAVSQVFDAAQARMKLIARVFAETGIRDLFWLLHATIRQHAKDQDIVRLNNQWVVIDPRNWRKRDSLTVQVGLGQGGKRDRLSEQMSIVGMQKDALLNGLSNLVTPKHLYNSAKEVTRIMEKDVELFFADPGDAPIQPKPDPEMMKLQAQTQIEKAQAEADIVSQQKKTEAEMAMAREKFELDKQLLILEHQLKAEETRHGMITDAVKASAKSAGNGVDGEGGGGDNSGLVAALIGEMRRMNGPKRIVRDASGRAVGTEPIN